MKKIAIIGAGASGLSAAYELLRRGYDVTIFEAGPGVAGLGRADDRFGFTLEVFYHYVFPSDSTLIRLAEELGVSADIKWASGRMGFFIRNRLTAFDGIKDVLLNPCLSIAAKIGFVVSTVWLIFFMDLETANQWTASSWFKKRFLSAAWEEIWRPLFQSKFDNDKDSVSLAWLWSKLRMRWSARSSNGDKFGYLSGSFSKFFESLQEKIESAGGKIHFGTPISHISFEKEEVTLVHGEKEYKFDHVVAAVAGPTLARLLADAKNNDYFHRFSYSAVIVVRLVLSRNLTNYWWINVAANDLPFVGLIEHTNLCGREEFDGAHIVYLSRYLKTNDELWSLSDAEITRRFTEKLTAFNPEFRREWIIKSDVHRAANAQPFIPAAYEPPRFMTGYPGLSWISMHSIFPQDRGINYAIEEGFRLAHELASSIK